MNSLTQMLEERKQVARLKAGKAAAEAARNSGSVALQTKAEQTLGDYLHYLQADELVSKQQNQMYHRAGTRSFFGDVVANSQGDTDAATRLKEIRAMSDYGALVVPEYLTDQIANSGHSTRPLCDLLTQPLGDRGGSVTLIQLSTGATASMQTTEGTAGTTDDPATTEITVPVRTVLSQSNLSLQITARANQQGLDQVVSKEILGAVLAQQEAQVLNGSGSSGQVTGLLQTSGAGSIALTSTSPYELLNTIAKAAQASHETTGRFPDTVVLAPRRWMWLLANAGDSAAAISVDQTASPIAGRICGLDVVSTASMPLTQSTDQDRAIVFNRSDVYLGETPAEVEIVKDLPQGAANLAARVRVHRYMAFGAIRPAGIQIIAGAGLANPYA